MMKTVAFLLLLSSTNAARVDNDIPLEQTSEDEYSKQQTMDARAPMIVDKEFTTDEDPTEDIQIQSEEEQRDAPVDQNQDRLIPQQQIQPEVSEDQLSQPQKQDEQKQDEQQNEQNPGMMSKLKNGIRKVVTATKDGAGIAYGKTANVVKTVVNKTKDGASEAKMVGKKSANTVSERSTMLAGLVKNLHARAIVAAVVLAISWVVVPWFIVRQIVEFITSKPKAGVISALITMFVVIPAALVAVLLHTDTYEKVFKFLEQDFFGKPTPKVEEDVVEVEDIVAETNNAETVDN